MRFNIPERFEDFHDGDINHWLNVATERFGECADALEEKEITPEQFAAIFKSFEKILIRAAQAGIENSMALELAGRHCTTPRRRYAYFARAYALAMEEVKADAYAGDLDNALWAPYRLADCAHEMGRIHEADGEMKKAAEFYALALRQIQEASDIADAYTQLGGEHKPRRPRYEASLERVRKLLK